MLKPRYLWCWQLNLVSMLMWGMSVIFWRSSALARILPARSLDTESSDSPPPQINLNNQSGNTKERTFILSQIPNPITPRPPKQPTPIPQPFPDTPLEIPNPKLPASESQPNIPGTQTIKRFEFEGNTALSDEELAEVTKPFTGEVTFAELLEAEAAVTERYIDAGYINSGAVIPAAQNIQEQDGVVKMQIIEGGVEDIKVTVEGRLNPNYVRSRLAIASAIPLNRNRLLEALQLLQLDPLIQNISAELSAGSRPQLSLLTVQVTEADSFNTELFTDNGRAPSVGSWRRGFRFNEGNLTGSGDRLNLEYTNTDGSNAFDGRYALPLNSRNSTLTLAGGLTGTEVVESPFDRLDITGDSYYLDLGFTQPIIQTPIRELALGLTASRQQSNTKLDGQDFPLAAGANDEGETRISALRLVQEYTQRSPQEVFAARSQFSLGLDIFNATVNEEPPDSRFFAWRGQGQYVRSLFPDSLLVVRSDLQFSTRALVPLEQFSLGGWQSVRGYRQDALLTDDGFFISAEVPLPILRIEKVEGVLQVVPFVDFGIGWNSADNPNPDPDPNSLVGVGLGLQWQMGDNFDARFDWGIPLTDVEDSDRTLQEQGLYFSINYSLF